MYAYCGFFHSTCVLPPIREVRSHDGVDLSMSATVTTLLLTIYSNINLGSYRVCSMQEIVSLNKLQCLQCEVFCVRKQGPIRFENIGVCWYLSG